MVPLLLLPLLWGGSLQQQPGYELQVQKLVTVQEGLCVHVPCSFSYPWSSWHSSSKFYTYWYRQRDNIKYAAPVASSNRNKTVRGETQGRFLLADPTTNNCSLDIRDARRSDSGRYYLRMEKDLVRYSYLEKMLELQVTALTEKPHIWIREPLESGRPTQLTCSLPGACEGGRPLTFSWAGAPVYSLDPQTPLSSVLTFTPRPRNHGTRLTCQVKLQGSLVATQRTIRLNVSYAPGNLTIGVSFRNDPAFKNLQTTSLSILEGEALRLRCEADSNPPAELSWFRGSPGLSATPLSSTAILELPRVGPAKEGEFTCQARHPLGSHSVSLSLSVAWKAVPQAGAVPAALGGAGAMALLSLCVCLIFFCIVKARRRQAAGRPKVTNDEEPVMGTVTWGSQKHLPPDAPPDQAPPAEKGPLSGEPQELYYANLTFEGLKPREPKDQEATSTHEYSEVKRARQ
ncbi:sialic acid-binding Ig-like lectin 11 isoform X8 [Myotis daubentonii]|uniref:sialic acid-binding Ig-like lectin 11 isoform X8 n=1 Tax=Myotis daubentonii TaxID=98922 RepID=UPI002872C67C|nr:sialic acid-binding Ig-like lectin 11 isoform X8 [Myotis daubentonii]